MSLVLSLSMMLPAIAAPPAHVATLRCGSGDFRLESRTSGQPGAALAPTGQRLTVRTESATRSLPIEDAGRMTQQGQRVQRAFVVSWACVPSSTGASYLSLGYACADDEGRGCGGAREWFRWLDTCGRPLDKGVPRSGGPRYEALGRRLGLEQAQSDGVAMIGVLE